MYDYKAFTQAVDYQKYLFDSSLDLLETYKGHGQRLVDVVFESNDLVPENGKQAYQQWVDFVNQSTETYRELVENGFDSVKDLLREKPVKGAPAAPKGKPVKKQG